MRDEFDGGPLFRMNTVFKLDYQAWVLFGIAGIGALAWWRTRLTRQLEDLVMPIKRHAANEPFAKFLERHLDEVFTFLVPVARMIDGRLVHQLLPATNHLAEQAIRPAVVNRKVWGGNRTENVSKDETITISANRSENVSKDESVSIGANRNHSVGDNDSLSVGKTLSASAGDEIALSTGSASIVKSNASSLAHCTRTLTRSMACPARSASMMILAETVLPSPS